MCISCFLNRFMCQSSTFLEKKTVFRKYGLLHTYSILNTYISLQHIHCFLLLSHNQKNINKYSGEHIHGKIQHTPLCSSSPILVNNTQSDNQSECVLHIRRREREVSSSLIGCRRHLIFSTSVTSPTKSTNNYNISLPI